MSYHIRAKRAYSRQPQPNVIPIVRNKEIHEWTPTFWWAFTYREKRILAFEMRNCISVNAESNARPPCRIVQHSKSSSINILYPKFHNVIVIAQRSKFQGRIVLTISQFSAIYAFYGRRGWITSGRCKRDRLVMPQMVLWDFRSVSSNTNRL
jgi:hypothetical protein